LKLVGLLGFYFSFLFFISLPTDYFEAFFPINLTFANLNIFAIGDLLSDHVKRSGF